MSITDKEASKQRKIVKVTIICPNYILDSLIEQLRGEAHIMYVYKTDQRDTDTFKNAFDM